MLSASHVTAIKLWAVLSAKSVARVKKRSMEKNYVDAPLVVRHLTSIARAVHLAQRGLLVILWSPWHGFLHTYASKCHGLPVETLPVLQNKRSDLKSIENVVIREGTKFLCKYFHFHQASITAIFSDSTVRVQVHLKHQPWFISFLVPGKTLVYVIVSRL